MIIILPISATTLADSTIVVVNTIATEYQQTYSSILLQIVSGIKKVFITSGKSIFKVLYRYLNHLYFRWYGGFL